MGMRCDIETVLIEHLDHIRRISFRVTKDQHMAEEAVQESVLTILEKSHNLKIEKNLKGWMNAVTKNKAIDCLNRKIKVNKHKDDLKQRFLDVKDPRNSCHEAILDTRKVEMILENIGSLTKQQKACVYKRFFLGMKTFEIARDLGVAMPVVSYHISVSLKKLRGIRMNFAEHKRL